MNTTTRRQRSRAFGQWGETLAVFALRLTGWRILARNLRLAGGEIDIIAERERVLAFIEVKSRPDTATAVTALGPRQRDRIVRAAGAYLAGRPLTAGQDARFDVMVVRRWGWPRRIAGAFRADGL